MKAKEFLSQRGVRYIEKNVERDRQAAMEMIRRSGQQGVPVITIGDQVVVGFNRPRLEALLAARAAEPAAGRPSFGALVGDSADQARRRPGIPPVGAYVGGVHPGTPAERAGLHTGDVITAVNMNPVGSAADLERALTAAGPAGRLVIAFTRDGTDHQVEATL